QNSNANIRRRIVLCQVKLTLMRFWLSILLIFALCAACLAAEKPHSRLSNAAVPKKNREAAEKEFKRAVELQKSGKLDDALQAVSQALQLYPGNAEYIVAREMLNQQMVGAYLDRGNQLAQAGDNAGAAAQFRAALTIDRENTYTQERLRDV